MHQRCATWLWRCVTLLQRCFNVGHRLCINVVERWIFDAISTLIQNVETMLIRHWNVGWVWWQIGFTDQRSMTKFDKKCTQSNCNLYLTLLTLFTFMTAKTSIMENLLSVRICTSPEAWISGPWITNKDCLIWSCLKTRKYWEKISGWWNWSSLVRGYTGWSLTSTGFWPGFKTAVNFKFKCIKWTCLLKSLTLSCYDGKINSIDTWWSLYVRWYRFCLNTEKHFL